MQEHLLTFELDDGDVRLDFKRPWSDGISSVQLPPLALITRLAALIPPPRRPLHHRSQDWARTGTG
jgi:hypothetical protein